MGAGMDPEHPTCYLCGDAIPIGERDDDHVPPKQFYPKALRTDALELLTLPTHKKCNSAYAKDEDYFVACLGILAKDTPTGSALVWDIARRSQRPEGQRLGQRILSHFTESPGGVYLPAGLVALQYERERIGRVLWKIVRGLYMHEVGAPLPEKTPRRLRILSSGDTPPPEFRLVAETPSKGKYPGVLDHKTYRPAELPELHYWGLLVWQELIAIAAFHDRECSCEKCVS